jgi:hypothetical protein
MKISDGDELSKIIVGQGLKYNKELVNNKEKEILFSKKYQVLSKNTALYAEITKFNDFQQKKLITVDLNKYMELNIEDLREAPVIELADVGDDGEEKIIKSMSTESIILSSEVLFDMNSYDIKGSLETQDDFEIENKEKESCELSKDFEEEIEDIKDINELTKLIITQNIFEGFWDENDETKKLIQILPKNKIMEIENKIKKLKKNEENKIKYTIFVLFYLEYMHKDKLDEFKLIINKANKFLMSHGIKYEDIINEHS